MMNGAAPTVVVRPATDRQVALQVLALVAVALAILYAWPYTLGMLRGVLAGHLADFGRMYYSARQFEAGRSMYGPSPVVFIERSTQSIHNLNPPHAHLPFLLLSRVPEGVAFVAGLALACVALVASLRAGLAAAGSRSWRTVAVVAAVLPLSLVTQATLGTGQLFAWWLVPLATAAWLAARRGRWGSAGAWLGVLAGLKLFVLLFVPYLVLTKRWKALAWFAVAFGASIVAGAAVFGWSSYAEWIGSLHQAIWYGNQLNGSLLGLTERLFGGITYRPMSPGARELATYGAIWPAAWLVKPLYYLAAAAVLAVSARVAFGRDIDRAFAVVLLAALLVSPLGSIYYLWLAAAPLTVLVATDARMRRRVLLAVPFALLPVRQIEFAQPHAWATVLFGCAAGWLVLAAWYAVVAAPVVAAPRKRL